MNVLKYLNKEIALKNPFKKGKKHCRGLGHYPSPTATQARVRHDKFTQKKLL